MESKMIIGAVATPWLQSVDSESIQKQYLLIYLQKTNQT